MELRKPAARRVAVVVSTELDCFREMLRGIHAFAVQQGGAWHLDVLSPADDFLDFIKQTSPDGLLVSSTYRADEENAVLHACPRVVAFGSQFRRAGMLPGLIEVDADNAEVGRVAANYFLTKGFGSFLFVGTSSHWSDERERGFVEAIEKAGHTVHIYREQPAQQRGRSWGRPRFGTIVAAGEALAKLLDELPHPLAVFACNDVRGRAVLELCLSRTLRSPEDIAVLGVDNDNLDCELSHPPLSSVAIPWRTLGHEAARMLDCLMSGNGASMNGKLLARAGGTPADGDGTPSACVEPGFYPITPLGVIERQSTDVVAIQDPDVAAAIRFIRDHAHRRIGVGDVLAVVPIARRALEKRFRDQLSRSPLEEIRRVRVDRAKQLLAQTDLSMPQVAERCGFATAAWFSSAFRALVGETPSTYRSRHRTT